MPYKNKEQQKAFQHQHYLENKTRHYSRAKQRINGLRQFIDDYKAKTGCSHCVENDPVCLDFHHLDPNAKDYIISDLLKRMSKEKIEEEMQKCVVLCSNCHRKEHRRLRLLATPPACIAHR